MALNPWVGVLAGSQVVGTLAQTQDRAAKFRQAQEAARASGKPLLVVGRPKGWYNHPCGDVTLDIDPAVEAECPVGGVVADVRSIPFPDGYFGAALASHVLEHLPTLEDVLWAWEELHRVAARVFVAGPNKLTLIAWLIPDHYHWVWQTRDGSLVIEPRKGG